MTFIYLISFKVGVSPCCPTKSLKLSYKSTASVKFLWAIHTSRSSGMSVIHSGSVGCGEPVPMESSGLLARSDSIDGKVGLVSCVGLSIEVLCAKAPLLGFLRIF